MPPRISHPLLLLFLAAVSCLTVSILAAPVENKSTETSTYGDNGLNVTDFAKRNTETGTHSKKVPTFDFSQYDSPTSTWDPPPGIEKDPAIDKLDELMAKSKCHEPKESTKASRAFGDIRDQVPVICKLKMPPHNKLVLRRAPHDPGTHGILGKHLGTGKDGAVFMVEGTWSGLPPDTKAVAKWFTYKNSGNRELNNLNAVGEILQFGVDENEETPSMWGIIKWKQGVTLRHLQSFIDAINAKDRKTCTDYMTKVRAAIVTASVPYLKRKGAPMHKDLHQGNVLFWEDAGRLMANLVDWARVRWGMGKDVKGNGNTKVRASEAQQKQFAIDIQEGMEDGYKWQDNVQKPDFYDFSDDNNCFQEEEKKQAPES